MNRWVKSAKPIVLLTAFFWAAASSTKATLISDDFRWVSREASSTELRDRQLSPGESFRPSSHALAAGLVTFALLGLGTLGYVWRCKRASFEGFSAGAKWHHRAGQEWFWLPADSRARSISARLTVQESKGGE
jgi:hypothetical protein